MCKPTAVYEQLSVSIEQTIDKERNVFVDQEFESPETKKETETNSNGLSPGLLQRRLS